MSGFNDNYVEVSERITEFYQRFPNGRLVTEIVELSDARVTVKALAYRSEDDKVPAVGHSWMTLPGTTSFTRGSELENTETSAVGRAIVMAGIPSKKVASADEVRAKAGPPPKAAPTSPSGAVAEGAAHATGHKPAKARQDGSLYCPTKLENGSWCPWKGEAAAAPTRPDPAAHAASVDEDFASLARSLS